MKEIDKIYRDLSNIQYGSSIFKGVYKSGDAIFVQINHQLYSGNLGLVFRDTEGFKCIRVGTDGCGMDLFVDVDISRFKDDLGYTFRTSTLNSILKAYDILSDGLSGKLYGFKQFLKGLGLGIQHPDLYIQRSAKIGTWKEVDDEILEYTVEANIPKPSHDKSGTIVDKFSLTLNNVEADELNFKISIERPCPDDIGIEWVINLNKTSNFSKIDKDSSELGLSQSLPGVFSFGSATKEVLQSVYDKFNNKIV